MMMLRALLVLTVVVTAYAENSYLITSPKRITLGQPYTVDVNILNATDDVDVEVSILRSWYNNSKQNKVPVETAKRRFQQGQPGTVTLTAPLVTSVGSYLLKVKGEGGLIFEREASLNLNWKIISVFIQTDKAMYKPGQRVHFRIFATYPDLKAYKGPLDVLITDPKGNKIRQWKNSQDETGVIYRDMLLSDQPVLGSWSIKVTDQEFLGRSKSKSFTVQQYELPKFEVKVELASFALTSDEELKGTIKANYTYGKGVKGLADVKVYTGPIRNYCGQLAKSVSKAFPIDGSADFSIPLSEIRKLDSYLNRKSLTVVAEVKEDLTGKTLNGTSKITYYDKPYKVIFLGSSPNSFKPGLPYRAYVKVSRQDESIVDDLSAGISVFTCVEYERTEAFQDRYECNKFTGSYSLPILRLPIPPDGVIPLDLDIPDNTTQVKIRAYYKEEQGSLYISKSQSPSDSYIQARLTTLDLSTGGKAVFDIQSTSPPGDVAYQVISKGAILSSGVASPANSLDTSLSLNLDVTNTMAPSATLLVHYVRPDGEIVADSITFNVEGIFANKVGIKYSQDRATPRTSLNVEVTADPQSNAFLMAVDQSVLLLKSGNDITTSTVEKELMDYEVSPAPISASRWRFPIPSSGKDSEKTFSDAGIVVITDANLYSEPPVYYYRGFSGRQAGPPGEVYDADLMSVSNVRYQTKSGRKKVTHTTSLAEVETVREIFPETWLWVNTTVGDDGSASIQTKTPDTITSWIASAFAISPVSGLGVAPTTAKLQVFRSFFVSLNLPLSIVRGEQVVLQATVFNYLETEQQVTVKLKTQKGFRSLVIDQAGVESESSDTPVRRITVPAGEGKAVYFPIVAKVIGTIDIEVTAQTGETSDGVKRSLAVKAEGMRKEFNKAVLVDIKSGDQFSETVKISLPPGLVEDSERTHLSITGDLLGPSIDNLESLLVLPTGCGEQNMLRLAPNIYIMDYLMHTKLLSRPLEQKITTYLEIGYQRQLSYQRSDKSFSTFGNRDEAGSVWLTAFVLRSFYQARRYIYIDDTTIDQALHWLLTKQTTDGRFVEPGKVIDKQLQGTTGSSPSLTAYVLLTLVEMKGHNGSRVNSSRLQKARDSALNYLNSRPYKKMELFPLAVTTYAIARADSHRSKKAFYQLRRRIKSMDDQSYWDVNVDSKKKMKRVESMDILVTAYGLLSFVYHNKLSSATPIVRWLTAQRNPKGGFMSSQDTSVALEALTKFMMAAQPENYNIDLTVQAGSEVRTATINIANSLLIQSIDLPSVPGELVITATGTGMALVELGVFYNVIPVENDNEVFDISTVLLDDTINGFTLMTCVKHLKEGSSGMCVQTIQIPSGFVADLSSIGNVAGLKRIEQKAEDVIVYYDELGKSSSCITLSCSRQDMVAKNKAAYISVVDYYKPGDNAVASYQPRRLKSADTCQICTKCSFCKAK